MKEEVTHKFKIGDEKFITIPNHRVYLEKMNWADARKKKLIQIATDSGYNAGNATSAVYLCAECNAAVQAREFGKTNLTSYARNVMGHIMEQRKNYTPTKRYAIIDEDIVCALLFLDSQSTHQNGYILEFGKN